MNEHEQPEDLLRYDILTQEALLSVIHRVLDEVSKTGLPGEHHFFITFDTQFKGVHLSDRMRERYPEEMTIVIQHTFWNLMVTNERFEIDLSFDDIQERLCIPFASIKGFFDPSVKFGLQFDLLGENDDLSGDETSEDTPVSLLEPAQNSESKTVPIKAAPREIKPAEKKSKEKKPKKKAEVPPEQPKEANEETGADVVSLDAFRKKK